MNDAVHINKTLEQWFLKRIDTESTNEVLAEDLLNQLTVVIPSYCRQAFLLRQIVYWLHSSVNVIILDGSPSPLSQQLQSSISNKTRFLYRHNAVHPVDRLKLANNLISTPYVVTLGDDEFHLFSGLRKAIKYLEINEDYVGCIGQSIRFYVDESVSLINYGRGYPHYGYKVDSESPRHRFEYAMESYNAATCYAVLRAQVWRDSWGGLITTSCKDTYEIQQAFATYAAGKLATLNEIYWLRSDENISVADTQNSRVSYQKWWLSTDFEHERSQVVARLAHLIEKYNKTPSSLAVSYAQDGWEMFLKFHQSSYPLPKLFSYLRLKGIFVKVIRFLLKERLYSRIKNKLIKNISDTTKGLRADLGMREELCNSMNSPLFNYDEETDIDLREVEYLVCDFYNHK